MSLAEYIQTKEYIVSVHDFQDLDTVYDDLETNGKSPANLDLSRSVFCVHRRLTSRNTHYLLTDWEAGELKNDTRIKSVTLAPYYLGISAGTNVNSQTSSALEHIAPESLPWDKSDDTSSYMKNWALLRCTEGVQRFQWGGSGYQGNGSGTAGQTGTIYLTQIGRNVDVVVCDEDGIVWNHPEYAVNADGTGGTRTHEYNWYKHNEEIGNGANDTYTYGTGSHSTHVAGTVAGNTQGWARSANIYNLYYDTGNPGNFSYVFDYIRAFHRNKASNPVIRRKNPTIVNNSWGQSIFPSEWSPSDITAVTYRGTRYTPSGDTIYTGYSGVCTSNARLATLAGFEYYGNRITTIGPYVALGGSILTKPAAWTQVGQQAYLTQLSAPSASYAVTVQGPADINLSSDVAANAISGPMSVQVEIVVKLGGTVISTYTGPLSSTVNGGTIESIVDESAINLPNSAVYTIEYNTTLDISGVSNPLIATATDITVITESTLATASVTSIPYSLQPVTWMASSTAPTTGNYDDGYWTLALPFGITFLGTTYSTIYVSTNHYVTFGAGSVTYFNLGPANPNLPKIMWACADNSVQRIFYGVEGTTPNRTYRVRLEGTARTYGVLGSPNMINEWIFYEATPSQIDLQCGQNARKISGAGFTTEQLNSWGFISGQRIPARVAACDIDLEDVYAEGIIMVGAAGNGRWKHDVPGGADWNNSFEMANRYPDSVSQPYFYMQGSSPTANDNSVTGNYDLPAICVGSVDTIDIDQKVMYSDCGPGVDIWAPGTYIMSSMTDGVTDPRNASYWIYKYSGTSMASPQVCGVLACALEIYPSMNQTQAKAYILAYAKQSQLYATTGGAADPQDLQGAANLFLYYYKERAVSGNTFPKSNYKPRPASGRVYPRSRIRKTL